MLTKYIKISNTLEQLWDLGKDYAELFIKMHNTIGEQNLFNVSLLYNVHNDTMKLLKNLTILIQEPNSTNLTKQKKNERKIEQHINTVLKQHIKNITQQGSYDSSYFIDALSILELTVAKCRAIRLEQNEELTLINK